MLQYIHCDNCDATYLVGIGGRSTDKKGSGGNMEGVPYVAFGCDELKDSAKVVAGNLRPCPKCGRECTVLEGFAERVA